jgi:hypothetical protein
MFEFFQVRYKASNNHVMPMPVNMAYSLQDWLSARLAQRPQLRDTNVPLNTGIPIHTFQDLTTWR